jgi:flagella basal body P-ring formation protein FlgA
VRVVARRRSALVGVGLALVALGALAFLYVSGRISEAAPVIAVVNDVQRGAVITADDVGVASVVPDPALALVPVGRIDDVIGQRAAADLVAGTLLTEAAVAASVVPAAGEAMVGLALTPRQMPGLPLLPGDIILIVATTGPG